MISVALCRVIRVAREVHFTHSTKEVVIAEQKIVHLWTIIADSYVSRRMVVCIATLLSEDVHIVLDEYKYYVTVGNNLTFC